MTHDCIDNHIFYDFPDKQAIICIIKILDGIGRTDQAVAQRFDNPQVENGKENKFISLILTRCRKRYKLSGIAEPISRVSYTFVYRTSSARDPSSQRTVRSQPEFSRLSLL